MGLFDKLLSNNKIALDEKSGKAMLKFTVGSGVGFAAGLVGLLAFGSLPAFIGLSIAGAVAGLAAAATPLFKKLAEKIKKKRAERAKKKEEKKKAKLKLKEKDKLLEAEAEKEKEKEKENTYEKNIGDELLTSTDEIATEMPLAKENNVRVAIKPENLSLNKGGPAIGNLKIKESEAKSTLAATEQSLSEPEKSEDVQQQKRHRQQKLTPLSRSPRSSVQQATQQALAQNEPSLHKISAIGPIDSIRRKSEIQTSPAQERVDIRTLQSLRGGGRHKISVIAAMNHQGIQNKNNGKSL